VGLQTLRTHDWMNVKCMWATGNFDQNVVIGIVDSGARGTHTLLKGSYLNKGFSWFDPEANRADTYGNNGHGSLRTSRDNPRAMGAGCQFVLALAVNRPSRFNHELSQLARWRSQRCGMRYDRVLVHQRSEVGGWAV
jgi:hypothetical protein